MTASVEDKENEHLAMPFLCSRNLQDPQQISQIHPPSSKRTIEKKSRTSQFVSTVKTAQLTAQLLAHLAHGDAKRKKIENNMEKKQIKYSE
jgi:hypothetical protein